MSKICEAQDKPTNGKASGTSAAPEGWYSTIAASLSPLRAMGRTPDATQYTFELIHEGRVPAGLPEFVRFKMATFYTGISRAKLYEGKDEGWVRTVSLRKKGQKFSVRLIHLPSLIEYLHKRMAEQNASDYCDEKP